MQTIHEIIFVLIFGTLMGLGMKFFITPGNKKLIALPFFTSAMIFAWVTVDKLHWLH